MIKVRPAAEHDVDAIFALVQRFAISFAVEEHAYRHSFSELIDAPDACMLVAEVQGQVVGYLLGFDHYTFYANGRVAWVEEIMVSEQVRRQGVRQHLMQAFEEWATMRGSRMVALATRRAAAFYQAIGYEESATYFRKKLL